MNDRKNRPRQHRRIFAWTALVISLNMVLASCWFDWGGSLSRSEPTPTATTEPMVTATATRTPTPRATSTPRPSPTAPATRTPTPRPSPTPSPTPTPEPVASQADLERILISSADLPGSWSESSAIDLGADSQNSICNQPGPDTVIDPEARAEVQLQQTDFGPFVAMNVSAYRSDDDAEEIMDYLREAISCDVWDDDARDRSWEIRPLTFPEKGDGTLSYRLTTSLGFIGNVQLHAVFVQTDNIITLVANGAIGSVDVDETEDIVDLALERVDGLR